MSSNHYVGNLFKSCDHEEREALFQDVITDMKEQLLFTVFNAIDEILICDEDEINAENILKKCRECVTDKDYEFIDRIVKQSYFVIRGFKKDD